MDAEEVEKMAVMEDWYWWHVANRNIVLRLFDFVLSRSEAEGERRILDVGCGTGALLCALEPYGVASGVDISEDSLRYSRQRGLERLHQSSSTDLRFEDASFDVLTTSHMLEHVADDLKVMREMHRVLAPGGWAVITVPAHMHLWSPHDVALGHERRYGRRDLVSKLEESGFEVEFASYSNALTYPPVFVLRLVKRLIFRRGEAKDDLYQLPGVLNRLLIRIFDIEGAMLRRGMRVPFGMNLACVCRKAPA